MPETYYIIPKEKHDSLVTQAYLKRGYDAAEAAAGARFCARVRILPKIRARLCSYPLWKNTRRVRLHQYIYPYHCRNLDNIMPQS
jgi:hypothetical protein